MSARDLIKKYEGLRLKAYPDPASGGSPWTIGYGHTQRIKQGDTCTKEQAEQWLTEDLQDAYAIVDKFVEVKLNQNQRDALASFVFNIGAGRKGVKDGFVTLKVGRPSSLLTKLNQGDFKAAAEEILKWDNAAGKKMSGLTKRRKEERELFLLVPTQEKPVAPFLIAAIPSLIAALPEFAKIFTKPDVAERNVEAVVKATEIIMESTGATNVQEAVEKVQENPQIASEANDALRLSRADLLDLMERLAKLDEDSVAAARAFSVGDKPILGNWLFVHILSLLFAVLGGTAAIYILATSLDVAERMIALNTLFLIGFGGVASFWLGSSRSSQMKDIVNNK